MSNTLMMLLIVEYAVIGIVCLLEGRYPMAMYWAGAILLNMAVLIGMKGG